MYRRRNASRGHGAAPSASACHAMGLVYQLRAGRHADGLPDRGATGRSTRSVVPSPGGLVTDNAPPRACTRSTRPNQAGAAVGIRAAGAVVAHTDVQPAADDAYLDDDGGAGVLDGVGERLGHHVIRRDLDRLGQAGDHLGVQFDRDHGSAGERHEGRRQAALGQDRRVDAPGQLPQLVQRGDQPVDGLVQLGVQVRRPGGTAASAVRSSSTSDTSRCWMPSCMSRSMRRRA